MGAGARVFVGAVRGVCVGESEPSAGGRRGGSLVIFDFVVVGNDDAGRAVGNGGRVVEVGHETGGVGTELGAGRLVLFGCCTRLAALSLTGTIAGAMWLTQIGPVIQDGTAMYGFLPPHKPWYDPGLWAPPLWQLALLGTGLALFFTGAGAVSVDRLLFKPKPAGAPAKKS